MAHGKDTNLGSVFRIRSGAFTGAGLSEKSTFLVLARDQKS